MKLLLLFILTGLIQMTVGRIIGVHDGLPQMVFTHWWQYMTESLFYSVVHFFIYAWATKKNS